METGEHLPGEPARRSGRYDELNVFGRQTGRTIEVEQGDRLPVLPCGFTWWHVPTNSGSFNSLTERSATGDLDHAQAQGSQWPLGRFAPQVARMDASVDVPKEPGVLRRLNVLYLVRELEAAIKLGGIAWTVKDVDGIAQRLANVSAALRRSGDN